jgi:hypothetical protein
MPVEVVGYGLRIGPEKDATIEHLQILQQFKMMMNFNRRLL